MVGFFFYLGSCICVLGYRVLNCNDDILIYYVLFQKIGILVNMRFQEVEERSKMFEELGQRLQYYVKIVVDFRDNVSFFVYSEELFEILIS